MAENMDLWNRVQDTDPKYAKEVSQRGGFTSVDGQYQLQRATAEWGKYGETWGLRDLKFELVVGESTMMLTAEFWYPVSDEVRAATDKQHNSFPIAVDLPFKPNQDICKKLMTQARSKSLSYLGFNADVYLGKFDDDHYVRMQETKYGDQGKLRKKILDLVSMAETTEELHKCIDRAKELHRESAIDRDLFNEVMQAIGKRKGESDGEP